MSFDELLSAASHLPPDERLRLSDMLRDTLPPEEWPELSGEWLQEIERRTNLYNAGQMPAAPWPEVRERTRRQAGLND